MTGFDWRDLELKVVQQHDVTDRWLLRGREFQAITMVEGPLMTAMPENEGPTLVRSWKDDKKCAKPLLTARSVEVRIGEGSLA